MLKKVSLLLIAFLAMQQLSAQKKENRKEIKTTRIENAPDIDGNLDDEAWKNAEIATDFVVFRPSNGKPVSSEYQTEVKVIYNDDAIYISAMMLDPDPSEIPREFATRDNFSQADFFLITINPNDDGQNPFEFIVQSTGNQGDAKISNGNGSLINVLSLAATRLTRCYHNRRKMEGVLRNLPGCLFDVFRCQKSV